jgi:hypothetical protein
LTFKEVYEASAAIAEFSRGDVVARRPWNRLEAAVDLARRTLAFS